MQSAAGAGDSCMEEVTFKLEKDIEAHSPGRWTSTWKGRSVGAGSVFLGSFVVGGDIGQ